MLYEVITQLLRFQFADDPVHLVAVQFADDGEERVAVVHIVFVPRDGVEKVVAQGDELPGHLV